MGRIIFIGSINMDVVVMTERHPKLGETIFGSDVQFIPGGKGSNQAVAASRLGDHVMLIGKLGQDAFGSTLQTFLEKENLDLSYLGFSETAPSGTALITVNSKSENTIIVVSGSNFELLPADIDAVTFNADDIVVAVFEVPQETIKVAFEKARAVGAKTVLNPAPAGLFIDGLQELCDYLVVNETELASFAGTEPDPNHVDQIRKQAQDIRSHEDQVIIVTLGDKGVVATQGDDMLSITGRKVDAVDTTAAGDCFVGALAIALSEEKPLQQALRFANMAASLSVQTIGASTSLPYRQAVDDLLNLS